MNDPNNKLLRDAIEDLYRVFEHYTERGEFCAACYSDENIAEYYETPLRTLGAEASRVLLEESVDHWQDSRVYRHYLPRILEVLAPPISCDPLDPRHLFEVLKYMNFRAWPECEQVAVVKYLELLAPLLEMNPEDKNDWFDAWSKL